MNVTYQTDPQRMAELKGMIGEALYVLSAAALCTNSADNMRYASKAIAHAKKLLTQVIERLP